MNQNLSDEYYTDDGCPIKCFTCDAINIKSRTVDIIANCVCETAYYCDDCGEDLGYWAYGSFNPYYKEGIK